MALAVSYPGVYVQAIIQPSPPDSGVATSLAAFIGRAPMGAVNTPLLLNSWGDYQRFFGGLDEDSSMSYQVAAFFNNGGGQALGVRLFEPTQTDAEINGVVGGIVTGLKAPVDDLYANSGSPAAKDIDAAVRAALAPTIAAGGINGAAANLILIQWPTALATLPVTAPTKAQAEAAVGSLDIPYTFTATLALSPLNPVNQAITALIASLNLQVLANASMEEVNLVTASLTNSYATQPGAAAALASLQPGIAAAASPAAALSAVGAGLTDALVAAVPELGTSAPPYDTIGPDATGAGAAMTAITGAAQTTQTAVTAAAAPGATIAQVQTAVDAFVTAHFQNDPGAAAVKTAVDAANGLPGLTATLIAAVEAQLPAAPANPKTWATAALTAWEANPQGDIGLAVSEAMLAGLSAEWPEQETLTLTVASPGAWGNAVTAVVDVNGITPAVAQQFGVTNPGDLFNLTVSYATPSGQVMSEQFTNVTLNPAYPARLLNNILLDQSQFIASASGAGVVAGAGGTGIGGRDSLALSMTTYLGDQNAKTGLYALENTPIFNILCIPPDEIAGDTPNLIYQTAAEYCVTRHAMLIVDPPSAWEGEYNAGNITKLSLNDLGSYGAPEGRTSAVYFPRVLAADPLRNGQIREFPNSGYMAGIWAQTDVQYGVWKAPAGLNAAINGISGLPVVLSDSDNGILNPLGINCLRTFPIGGSVVWGARTLRGADQLGDQYNYIPVQRLLLYLEDWTLQNTKWAVFQPNDESLWSGLRTQISTMLNGLWKQGALFGTSADQAYFVNCDATTTLQSDIDAGRVNVQIGFAPVKPAEFVVVTLQQIAGQS